METSTEAYNEKTAQYIAEFITYNNIDLTVVPMGIVVKRYFETLEKEWNNAGIKALGFFCDQK